jgi:hypothetical protein
MSDRRYTGQTATSVTVLSGLTHAKHLYPVSANKHINSENIKIKINPFLLLSRLAPLTWRDFGSLYSRVQQPDVKRLLFSHRSRTFTHTHTHTHSVPHPGLFPFFCSHTQTCTQPQPPIDWGVQSVKPTLARHPSNVKASGTDEEKKGQCGVNEWHDNLVPSSGDDGSGTRRLLYDSIRTGRATLRRRPSPTVSEVSPSSIVVLVVLSLPPYHLTLATRIFTSPQRSLCGLYGRGGRIVARSAHICTNCSARLYVMLTPIARNKL